MGPNGQQPFQYSRAHSWPMPNSMQQFSPPSMQPGGGDNKGKLILIIAGAATLVLLITAGVVAMSRGNKSETTTAAPVTVAPPEPVVLREATDRMVYSLEKFDTPAPQEGGVDSLDGSQPVAPEGELPGEPVGEGEQPQSDATLAQPAPGSKAPNPGPAPDGGNPVPIPDNNPVPVPDNGPPLPPPGGEGNPDDGGPGHGDGYDPPPPVQPAPQPEQPPAPRPPAQTLPTVTAVRNALVEASDLSGFEGKSWSQTYESASLESRPHDLMGCNGEYMQNYLNRTFTTSGGSFISSRSIRGTESTITNLPEIFMNTVRSCPTRYGAADGIWEIYQDNVDPGSQSGSLMIRRKPRPGGSGYGAAYAIVRSRTKIVILGYQPTNGASIDSTGFINGATLRGMTRIASQELGV